MAVETLAAVAHTESGFDTLTLHDNSTGRSYHLTSREAAVALGIELATVDRHSVDFGLMQINGANLPRLGLSIADAFDPCRNLAAADHVLVDDYNPPAPGQNTQPAVQQALSRYNTGDPMRGVANGYVGRVQASVDVVVPALRIRDAIPEPSSPPETGMPVLAQPLPPLPPSWDVYARAKAGYGQLFAPSAVPAPVVPVSVAAAAPLAPPVPPRRLNIEAMNDAH